jgi:tRNA(Ile)-lysidine synthase
MAGLGPWPAAGRVGVAVSGGADSLCLAWLTAQWGRPFGLIVDHGLRAESAEEAALTAARLAAFGVQSRVLRLNGLARGPGLAARARAARYAALTAAARDAGLSDLLLGHHAGDQAETILLREAGHSGETGLSGMAAIFETASLRLVRPLLGNPPARLRATLRQAGLAWVDDPSNRDPSATRTTLRARIGEPGGDGLVTEALLARALAAGRQRAATDAEIARELATRVSIRPEGFALLSPGPVSPGSLAALVRALTGADYPARGTSLARMAADPRPGVLAGLRLLPAGHMGPGWLLVREAAAMSPPVPAADGIVWDRRFRLTAPGPLPAGCAVGAVGSAAKLLRKASSLPACVLQTLPALWLHDSLVAVPHIGYDAGSDHAGISLVFAPPNPASGAPFAPCDGGAKWQLTPHVDEAR